MILYPAIDLKGGQCVRLIQGDMERATVFNADPVAQARAFQAQGFRWLHVVDLDGAFAGHAVNAPAVKAVLTSLSIPVQLGGGIRDHAAIDLWIEKGVARVILGTVALRDPDLVRTACRRHPGRIAVGIDARGGRVAVEGWAEQSEVSVFDLAHRFEDAGVARIVYTNIERDGALRGVDIEGTVALAEAISIPVIASGGLSSLADLRALKQANCPSIEGVISGRALYDGRISPKAALDLLAA